MTSRDGKMPAGGARGTFLAGCVALLSWAPHLPAQPATAPAGGPPAQPATAPADGPVDCAALVAAAERSLGQLEGMRIAPAAKPDGVADRLRDSLAPLDAGDRVLGRQLRDMGEDKPAPGPGRAVPTEASDERRRLRACRCQIALLRGRLYLAAAMALPDDDQARGVYLASAISVHQSLRVVYRDLPLAWMGYLGEARAQRVAGNTGAAYQVLGPLLRLEVPPPPGGAGPGGAVLAGLHRAAMLENLEIHLEADPARAVTEGHAWGKSPDIAAEPIWRGRCDWVVARALAVQARTWKDSGVKPQTIEKAIARAAALLRSKAVVDVAPGYDRLAVLAALDGLGGAKLMTRAELLQWGDVLVALGRPGAAGVFARAQSMPGGPLPPETLNVYAGLLWRKGDAAGTAEACDALLKQLTSDDPRRPAAVKLRAAALLKLYRQADADDAPAGLVGRLLSALEAVMDSKLPPAARRAALRQWVSARARQDGLGACVAMLTARDELVGQDGYLLYSRAAGGWTLLTSRLSAGEVPQAATEAGRLQTQCAAARDAAERDGMPDVSARSVLLRARILFAPPLRDARSALNVVRDGWEVLRSDKATSGAAAWLRVELLLDLGLTDAALKALGDLPEEDSGGPAAVLLQLAESVADRYAGADPAARRRVVELCNRALAQAVEDEKRYVASARRSARAMLTVGANTDAISILGRLLQSKAVRADRAVALDCSLMLARAMRQAGKLSDAKLYLQRLNGEFSRSPAVHLAQGRLAMEMKQPADAVKSFRQARKLCPSGSPEWCEATLALAEGLHAAGHTAGAGDVLRVSQALYPRFGSPELLARLKRLAEKLKLHRPGVRRRS